LGLFSLTLDPVVLDQDMKRAREEEAQDLMREVWDAI
jgi:hypothetical protein